MFTAPRAGVYMITFSYQTSNVPPGGMTVVYLYKNGERLQATENFSGYYTSRLWFTGGRVVYQRLKAGNKLHLQTSTVSVRMDYILLCVEFLHN